MTIQSRDVAEFVTHADIVNELGSERSLRNILPPSTPDTVDPTKSTRVQAYRDVLKVLERRRPAIIESMLADLDDVKDAVIYGTLARLFRAAVTADGDRHHVQWKHYQEQFNGEVRGLVVKVDNSADVSANTLSIPIDRR